MITRGEFIRGSLAAAAAVASPASAPSATALDRYIALPTPEYSWEVVRTNAGHGYRSHVVSMVSQRWRTEREVDRPLWRHWMTIIEPDRIKSNIGILVISGGSNGDQPPGKIDPVIADIAVRIGALVGEVRMVPNQPLSFTDEHRARGEDDLVAYTWDKYLRTGDDTWPLRLPMTKAAVRAMDTLTAYSMKARHSPPVDRFIVGGSSKRGWTAWLTAAADSRVVAIVPVVIDVLNVEVSSLHAYRVYGMWPKALESYEKMGIMRWFGTPQLDALLQIEDPYSYRERITVPKLIVNATGDQFFTPDSWQFYFNGLIGEKYLRYLPNTDHSLRGVSGDASKTAIAFLDDIINATPRPNYAWQLQRDGSIRVQSASKPLHARLWTALNVHNRDFRLETVGRAFWATDLQDRGGFTYVANVPKPAQGYAAYFVELAYATERNDVFTVTTGVRIVPDVLPYGLPRR
jgi:PhoPQ-activated pathogenicity-related protein